LNGAGAQPNSESHRIHNIHALSIYFKRVPATPDRSPPYWRDLSAQLRDIAERMTTKYRKQMMLIITDDYDRRAAAIERKMKGRRRRSDAIGGVRRPLWLQMNQL
jgi:hypothetical protein